MADTVQDGSLLDADTWGGTVPTSGTGNVLHACTGGDGTINCDIHIAEGGTLQILGALVINGNLTSSQLNTGGCVPINSGSLHVTGDVHCPDAVGATPGSHLIAQYAGSVTIDGDVHCGNAASGAGGIAGGNGGHLVVMSAGTLRIKGDVYGGAGGDGENGANADLNGNGMAGGAGGEGGFIYANGGTIQIDGTVLGAQGGSGGDGGSGYADADVAYYGGSGGNGGPAGWFRSGWLVTITVGAVQAGANGAAGNGGAEVAYDTNVGAGGGGGNAAAGGYLGWMGTDQSLLTVRGGITRADATPNGSNGSGSQGGGGGAGRPIQPGIVFNDADCHLTWVTVVDYPSEDDVRAGITYGEGKTGNLVEPAVGDVRSGVGYGANGTEYTGTWDGSGGGFTGSDRTKLEAVWAKLPADHNLAGDNITAALENILTETRGQKIDRLDATISSRASAAHWTPTRGAYLDNLNVGGPIASQAEVVAIQNNTRCVRVVPGQLVRPSQGSTACRIELLLYDQAGGMEEPDAPPTIGVVNQQGQTRDANLDSTTMTLVSAGRYRSIYTVADTHAAEELIVSFRVVEGGQTRVYANPALVVDSVAVDFTAGDRSQLAAIYQKLPGAAYLRGTTESDGGLSAGDVSEIGAAVTPPDNASIAAIKAKTDLLPPNPSARGDAMTLTAVERNAIADAVLSRDVSQVEAAAAEHSLCYTVLVMSESNTTAHAGKLTVYRTDGTTEFIQKTIASAGGAAAITGVS